MKIFVKTRLQAVIGQVERLNSRLVTMATRAIGSGGIFNRPRRLLDIIMFWVKVIYLTRKLNPTLVVGHDLYGFPAAWLLARLRGSKLMYDAVEMTFGRFRIRPPGILSRFLLRRAEGLAKTADLVLAGDPFLANNLTDRYAGLDPVTILNIVDSQHVEPAFNLRDCLEVNPEAIISLYCGLISEQRGLKEAIKAVTFMPENYVLVLMGHGRQEYRRELSQLAENLGVGHRFFLLDPVTHNQVVPICQQADLGLNPISSRFGNSKNVLTNKLFQYLAAQIPIVGVKETAVGTFIEHHEIGVNSDSCNARDIAAAINELHRSDGRQKRIAEKLKAVSLQYNWSEQAETLNHHLDRILDREHPNISPQNIS